MSAHHDPRKWSWPMGIPDSLNGGSAPLNPSSMPDRRPKPISDEQVLKEVAMIRVLRNGSVPGVIPKPGEGRALLERQRRLAMEAQGRA